MKNRIVIAACILLGLCPALLQAQDNDGINAIYERMSAAYAALDSQAFVDIYAADAAYLRSDENPMLTDIDAIIDNYERYFASVREGNGRLELLFRVIKRGCVSHRFAPWPSKHECTECTHDAASGCPTIRYSGDSDRNSCAAIR